jgi:hypothetical protein
VSELCLHEREYGRGATWPDEVSLDHFYLCLDATERLKYWRQIMANAQLGSMCIIMGHELRIEDLTHRLQKVR